MDLDRRSFLRQAAVAGLFGPAGALWGCGGERDPNAESEEEIQPPPGAPITRPVLLYWEDGVVYMPAPLDRPPAAYVSRAQRRVYVDPDLRDQAHRLLGAHISVSTGLWRIPLPGDDLRVPIMPGDEAREFVETDLSEWHSDIPPMEGDTRLRRGELVRVRVALDCVPVLEGGGRVSAGPRWILRREGIPGRGGREVLGRMPGASRYSGGDCDGGGEPVDLLTWMAPEP